MSLNESSKNQTSFAKKYLTDSLSRMSQRYARDFIQRTNSLPISSFVNKDSNPYQIIKDVYLYSSCTAVNPVEHVDNKALGYKYRIIANDNLLWKPETQTRDCRGLCSIRNDLTDSDLNSAHIIEEKIMNYFSSHARNKINTMKRNIGKYIQETIDNTINEIFKECETKISNELPSLIA